MGFYVPHVINGSKHSARLFRRTLQKQCGAGSGVDQPGDLRILPLNQPGTGFRVMPGGAVVQSRDTVASARESYGPVNDAEIIVTDVPGTGSQSTRRDLVILEITDPEMESVTYPEPTTPEGWQDGDNFCRITVIPDVDSLVPAAQRPVKSLDQITVGPYANVSGVTLGAINWPKSTTTITASMVEDLRKVQSPFSNRVWRTVNLDDVQRLSSASAYPAGGQTWPTEFTGEVGKIPVPSRATHARIRMDWGSIRFMIATKGSLWVQLGQNVHPDVRRTRSMSFDSAAGSRESLFVADTIAIPESMRGTDQWFFPRANLTDAIATEAQRPYVNTTSGIVLDVEFFEDAV